MSEETLSGCTNVSGGRHTLHYKIDSGDDNAEPDESDNTFGHQFVWSPRRLTAGTIYSTNGIRNNMAGWDYVTDGSSGSPRPPGSAGISKKE